jgi:hypothetical protein
MWAAGRSRVPATSPVHMTDPLPVSGVTTQDLRTLRSLLARGLGLRGKPARLTLWEWTVGRWKPLEYTLWG